jgi:ubiquinone/menaquinone biosynthesis C-methylase UbiE
MTGVDPEVIAFYERGDEAGRLESLGRLEFARTMELLERFLPPVHAVVLDVGGGAGAYALPLARRGYKIHLMDPIALHLEQALAAAEADPAAELASARIGDARALPQADASVDVVLLLGPLYHLTEAAQRERALGEALRVLRPGGVLAAVGISRFASTLHGILRGFLLDPAFEPLVAPDVAKGQHRNPDDHPCHAAPTSRGGRARDLRCGSSSVAVHAGGGTVLRTARTGGCRQGRRDAPQIACPTRP